MQRRTDYLHSEGVKPLAELGKRAALRRPRSAGAAAPYLRSGRPSAFQRRLSPLQRGQLFPETGNFARRWRAVRSSIWRCSDIRGRVRPRCRARAGFARPEGYGLPKTEPSRYSSFPALMPATTNSRVTPYSFSGRHVAEDGALAIPLAIIRHESLLTMGAGSEGRGGAPAREGHPRTLTTRTSVNSRNGASSRRSKRLASGRAAIQSPTAE